MNRRGVSGSRSTALGTLLRRPVEELLDELVADAKAFLGCEVFEGDVCLLAIELARLVVP